VIITLGIDTGDTAGFGLGGWTGGERKAATARAWQCDGDSAALLLRWILRSHRDSALTAEGIAAVQVEAFDDRPRNHGLRGTHPAGIRAQVTELQAVCAEFSVPCYVRTASVMKNWSLAAGRLERAGLSPVTEAAAMKHARDAMGHALFCAVHDCGLPDPLSRASRTREIRDVPG
jgi:hypothetical protein